MFSGALGLHLGVVSLIPMLGVEITYIHESDVFIEFLHCHVSNLLEA